MPDGLETARIGRKVPGDEQSLNWYPVCCEFLSLDSYSPFFDAEELEEITGGKNP